MFIPSNCIVYYHFWKSVNPKGNQSWIFISKTDAETEAPILIVHKNINTGLHIFKILYIMFLRCIQVGIYSPNNFDI